MIKTFGIIVLCLVGILTAFIIYSWVNSDYHENYRIESTDLKALKYNVTQQGPKLSNLKELKLGDTLALFIKLNVRYIDTGLDDIGLALFLSPPPGANGPLDKIDKITIFTSDDPVRTFFGLTRTDYSSKKKYNPEYLTSETKEIEQFQNLYNNNRVDETMNFNYFIEVDSLILVHKNIIMHVVTSDNKTIRSNKIKW